MIGKVTLRDRLRGAAQQAVNNAAPGEVRRDTIAALRAHPATAGLGEDVLVREVDHALAEAKVVNDGRSLPQILARRLAAAIEGAPTRPRVVALEGSKAFGWLPEPKPADATTSAGRFEQAFGLTTEVLSSALVPSGGGTSAGPLPQEASSWFHHRTTLPLAQAEEVAVRMRAVNAAVFSPVTRDMAVTLREVAQLPAAELAAAPRVWAPPQVLTGKKADSKFRDVFATALRATTLVDASGRPTVVEAPRALQTGPLSVAGPQAIDDLFYCTVPVGAYGEPLTRAIVEAVRLACAAIDPHAAALERTEAWRTVGGTLTFNPKLPGMLREGIVSLAQALGIILGQRCEPAMTVDTLLERVGTDGLLVRMAVEAPFGVIAPLAGASLVAADPITVGPNGRLRLPEGLHATFKQTLASRANPSAASKPTPDDNNRTQTLRGCPVAMRAPEVAPDGTVAIAPHSALHELSVAFVDLVRRVYAAQSAVAPG